MVRPLDGRFQILDGFKRHCVAVDLGWESLEARILDISLAEGKVAMFSNNRSGRSLPDYDEAMVILSLKPRQCIAGGSVLWRQMEASYSGAKNQRETCCIAVQKKVA